MSPKFPVDLSSLNSEQFKEWLDSFDVVLCDCDGVLWYYNDIVKGTNDVINRLVKLGKTVYLITNNSQTSCEQMHEKCLKMGFDSLGLDSMIVCSKTTAKYLQQLGFEKKAYVIGPKALVNELEKVGIETLGFGPDLMVDPLHEYVPPELKRMDRQVGAVVLGFDEHISFPKLFKAVNYLRNPATLFIATNDDDKLEFPNFTFPDVGPMLAAIEKGAGRKATVLGKPSDALVDIALKHEAHRERNRFLMIGDRLNTDIIFANKNKFQSLLVESGVHKIGDVKEVFEKLEACPGDQELERLVPAFYLPSLGQLFEQRSTD